MTYKEAAIEALRLVDNEPKTARELWDIIDKKGLKQSDGKTPWATLDTTLGRNSDKPYGSTECNGDPVFERLEEKTPDEYRLLQEQNEDSEQEPIEEEQEVTTVTEVTSPEVDWKKVVVVNNNGNLEYHTENCSRYTYFIIGQHKEKVKIGTTTQTPDQRAKSMQTSHPNLNVAIAIPASRLSETEAHEKFDNERHRGEWFFRTKRIRDYIDRQQRLVDKVIERHDYEAKMTKLDAEVLEMA